VDLNGDGKRDIISGSWPGQLFLFHGVDDGQFKKPVKIKDKEGKEIKVGSASAVYAHDWDSDGDLDLLVGNIRGEIYFIVNAGTKKAPAFGGAVKLSASGKTIRVPGGDSGPVVVDWDGDGKHDLLSGAGDGSVVFFKNTGSNQKPTLAAQQILIKVKRKMLMSDEAPVPCGGRSKIAVVDWNNDGALDILVGDFNSQGKKVKLTKEDMAKRAIAEAEWKKHYAAYREHAKKRPQKDDVEAMKTWQAESRKLSTAMRAPRRVMSQLNPIKRTMHGNVWLYPRKVTTSSTELKGQKKRVF
jgi:hypothetical protein